MHFATACPGARSKRDRDRLAPEVGGGCRGPRIAPPGIADEMLAGQRQAGQRLDIARVVGERGEIPSLRLGRELRRDFALQSAADASDRALGDPEIRCPMRAKARRLAACSSRT